MCDRLNLMNQQVYCSFVKLCIGVTISIMVMTTYVISLLYSYTKFTSKPVGVYYRIGSHHTHDKGTFWT